VPAPLLTQPVTSLRKSSEIQNPASPWRRFISEFMRISETIPKHGNAWDSLHSCSPEGATRGREGGKIMQPGPWREPLHLQEPPPFRSGYPASSHPIEAEMSRPEARPIPLLFPLRDGQARTARSQAPASGLEPTSVRTPAHRPATPWSLSRAYLTTTPPCTTRQLQPSPLKPLKPFTFHFSPSLQSLSLNSSCRLPTSSFKFQVSGFILFSPLQLLASNS